MFFHLQRNFFALVALFSIAAVANAASTQANAIPLQSFSTISFYKVNTAYSGLFNPRATFMRVNTLRGGVLNTSLDPFYNAQRRSNNFPFAMVVKSGRGTEIGTGASPVYSKLVTLVSQDMAFSAGPVYATPLTTLAYEMTQLSTAKKFTRSFDFKSFEKMSDVVRANFGLGMSPNIDIVRNSSAHNETINSDNARSLVTEHRTAIEAFTAALLKVGSKTSKAKLASFYASEMRKIGKPAMIEGATVNDILIKILAYDYYADGSFDGKIKGRLIPGLSLAALMLSPQSLAINGTNSQSLTSVPELLETEASQQGFSTSYPATSIAGKWLTASTFNATSQPTTTSSSSSNVLTKSLAPTTSAPVSSSPPKQVTAAIRAKQFNPGHYVTLNSRFDINNQIRQAELKNSRIFVGAQVRYWWNDLERREGNYDFSAIEKHLALLGGMGKKMVIQIDTILWGTNNFGFPSYLATGKYAGGYFRRKSGSAVPKKYNPMVAERMRLLVRKLGEKFDRNPNLEAIVIGETALGVDDAQNRSLVTDYSPGIWKKEIIKLITEARSAFPTTNIIHYINYLDRADRFLADVVTHAKSQKVGIGGPDLRPNNAAAWRFHYKYYETVAGQIPLGTAVQWDNYSSRNPATGKTVTTNEILNYGLKQLHLNYIFWEIRPPYFNNKVIPMLRATNAPINN